MSKQGQALANAERIADEAIHLLDRLSTAFGELLESVTPTYPESFDEERNLITSIDAEVLRLRDELEGEP